MMDADLAGRLVILTVHMDAWLRRSNPTFNVIMANRIAKIVKVFDWESEEGKLLLSEREKTGKWTEINPKDYKFVLKIYYPELYIANIGRKGMTIQEVAPRYYPGTEKLLFELVPEWMLKDLQKEEKDILKVKTKRDESKRIRRKSK